MILDFKLNAHLKIDLQIVATFIKENQNETWEQKIFQNKQRNVARN